jgi:hypothetical protein
MVIILMVISGYSIGVYWWLLIGFILMVIGDYFINVIGGYSWLFY